MDIAQLTGGAYKAADLATAAGLGCFVSENTRLLAPGIFRELFTGANTTAGAAGAAGKAMGLLEKFVLNPPDAGCPKIEEGRYKLGLFDIYPGIRRNAHL